MTRNSSASAWLLVGHGAEHERGDAGVEGSWIAGEPLAYAIDDGHGDRGLRRRALCAFA